MTFQDQIGALGGQRGASIRMSATAELAMHRQTIVAAKMHEAAIVKIGGTQAEATTITRQWSTANKANIASFEGMTSSIGKAIMKVTLWMVATTLVIGALQKVTQVTQLWKDLEITLERIGITTSTWGDALYKYFETTADVARRMGMPIEQTLKGMDLALRATARYGDEIQRTAVATIMLRDAAILGNIAGMQFDQAIDILVGSLRQTGMELHEGTVLLDKWVAVAKNAAVSVNDLSQGFAIMSSAAASAGLNIDQVNGLIAALSESVTLGPIEIGNAIRALMATLYNPGSIATMGRFGVAVADATGEFRSFWDIMNELSSMVVTGALSENQILQIAKAAGAGQRRYAQFIALLKNWSAAVDASSVSSMAQGDALEANERIVNTLTNAWDQFTAAQNKFWYALGEGSGAITELTQLFQGLAGAAAWMADWNDSFLRLLKTLAQITVALLVMKVAMIGMAKLGLIGWAGGVLRGAGSGAAALVGYSTASRMAPGAGKPGYFGAMGPYGPRYMTGRPPMGQTAGGAWGGMVRPRGFGGGALMGGMVTGLIAREITGSNWVGVGSAIGGGVGFALGGPIGLAIGGTIGGVIASFIEDATKSFSQKIREEEEKWLSGLDPGLRHAMEMATRDLSLAGFEFPVLGIRDDKRRETAEKDLGEAQDTLAYWKEQAASPRGRTGTIVDLIWKFTDPSEEEITAQVASWEQKVQKLTSGIELYLEPIEGIITLDQQLAESAKEIREEYGLQAMALDEINKLKQIALDMTSEEFEKLRDLLGAFPVAYGSILSQMREFFPGLAGEFEKLYPPEEFMEISPEAFAPLRNLLSTIKSSVLDAKELDEALTKVANLDIMKVDIGESLSQGIGTIYELLKYPRDPLTKEEFTTENIKKALEAYRSFAEEERSGQQEKALLEAAKEWGIVTADVMELNDEQRDRAVNNLNSIITLLNEAYEGLFGKELWVAAREQAESLAETYLDAVGRWKEPGRIEFVGQWDVGQIESTLAKYKTMFEGYLTSDPQVYHAFVKDEQGVVQGVLETFADWQPEVWSAMLSELRGIESNTGNMLEWEYNLPSGYARPGRYWAMKTTGTSEFGPMQEGLWETWEEFLRTLDDDASKVTEPLEDAIATFDDSLINTASKLDAFGAALLPLAEIDAEVTLDPTKSITEKFFPPNKILTWLASQFPGMQSGGLVTETGPYVLHRGEIVSPESSVMNTNNILGNTHRTLMTSQNYLAQINSGISELRQEIVALRRTMSSGSQQEAKDKTGEFSRATGAGYAGFNSLGIRRS